MSDSMFRSNCRMRAKACFSTEGSAEKLLREEANVWSGSGWIVWKYLFIQNLKKILETIG